MALAMGLAFGGCVEDGRELGEGDADESTGPDDAPDPRVAFADASYLFDSGCTPYESASVRVTVTAIDASIQQVTLTSYQIHGYMSGMELEPSSQDPEGALPLAIGESVELRFHDSRDGWAGECADWEPPEGDVLTDAMIAIDGDPVEVHGMASVGCGWSEC